MRIKYTHTARQDLRSVYEYIAYTLLNPDSAELVAERILAGVRSLEELPERNPLYREEPWYSQGIRFMPVGKYLVFYLVNKEEETVSVSRILYGGRDVRHQLETTSEW